MNANEYAVGLGGFLITSMYVIILAFLWRAMSAKFAASDNPMLQNLGAAMGSTL